MFSPVSSPCVQLSSPAAHADPLPCYTYICTHIHPQAPTHSPFTAPPSPKPPEQKYHLHKEAEKLPILCPFPAACPPPQPLSLSSFPHPSAPTLQEHQKPGGEAEDLLPLLPSRGVLRLGSLYPQLLLFSSPGREGWWGPADSSQMLAKCSYVITVFSILPSRPL